jgi:uncharacterized membrane protein
MDGIADFEQRIMAALARIDAGVERRMVAGSAGTGPSPVVMAELDRLREDLDEERMANAQMAERLKVQRERADRAAADLKAEVERLTRQVDDQALAMQRLVTATIQMREDLRRLRGQAAERVDSGLIDKAMASELEAGNALREAETAELADLVAALTPIVQAAEAQGEAHQHV